MKLSRPCLSAVFFVTVLVLPSYPAIGQPSGPPRCEAKDLIYTPIFLNGPGTFFTLAFEAKNISSRACIPNGPSTLGHDPLVISQPAGHKPFQVHPLLDNTWDACHGCAGLIVLQPGDVANFSYRWSTVSEEQPSDCFTPQTISMSYMSASFFIDAPDLVKPVCSDIDPSAYQRGPFAPAPDSRETSQLAVPGRPLYEGDRFYLQIKSPTASLPDLQPTVGASARLSGVYLWQRAPDGRTDFRRAMPWYFECCRPGHVIAKFDVSPSNMSIDTGAFLGVGEYKEQLYVLSPRRPAVKSPTQFLLSNIVTLHVLDPAGIKWSWGPHTKGLGMAISLDKPTYTTGEQIPVHLAVENFEVESSVHGWSINGDPMFAINLRLLDSTGNSIGEVDGDPGSGIGHGWGPTEEFPRGKLVTIERSLVGLKPGSYTLVAAWAAYIGSDKVCTSVQAKATIRVLPDATAAEATKQAH
jgi:hypothetical protein